jgi:amino acid permease
MCNRNTTPDRSSISEGFSKGYERTSISALGIFNSLPIIIFSFMYQINVPALYTELKVKNMESMTRVLILGTSLACVCYIIAGIFGFVSFAATDPIEDYKKIFE